MAMVRNCMRLFLDLCPQEGPREASERLANMVREQNRMAAENASLLLSRYDSAVTLSQSSLVREAMVLSGLKRVFVLESRPMREGVLMCRSLRGGSVREAIVVPDGMVSHAVARAEVAVSGCDAILSDASIVNKSGTLPLFLVANGRGKGTLAIGTSMRFDGEHSMERPPAFREMGCTEVEPGLDCLNVYFEVCPPSHLIGNLVTEKGTDWRRSGVRN